MISTDDYLTMRHKINNLELSIPKTIVNDVFMSREGQLYLLKQLDETNKFHLNNLKDKEVEKIINNFLDGVDKDELIDYILERNIIRFGFNYNIDLALNIFDHYNYNNHLLVCGIDLINWSELINDQLDWSINDILANFDKLTIYDIDNEKSEIFRLVIKLNNLQDKIIIINSLDELSQECDIDSVVMSDKILKRNYKGNAPKLVRSDVNKDLKKIFNIVRNDAKIILSLPSRVLNNDRLNKLVKTIVDKNQLKTVIEVEDSFENYSNLILVKDNEQDINFIYCKIVELAKNDSVSIYGDKLEKAKYVLKDIVDKLEQNGESSIMVSQKRIIKNDYNLSVEYYLNNIESLKISSVLLGKVANTYRGKRIDREELLESDLVKTLENGYLLNISDIQEYYLTDDFNQIISKDLVEKYKANNTLLKENDIVLTARGSFMKMAMVDKNAEKLNILPGDNVNVIRLYKNDIDPYYLFAFLNSKLGSYYLNKIETGERLFVYSNTKLEQMEILMLDSKIQAKIANEMKNNIEKLREAIKQQRDSIHNIKKIFNETMEIEKNGGNHSE